MKESVGGTFLFQIVIMFVLLFTGIMCLTINHTKAFAVKDDVVQYIENNGGILVNSPSGNSHNQILSDELIIILTNNSYYTTGDCNLGEKNINDENYIDFVGFQRDGSIDSSGKKSAICVRVISADQTNYLNQELGPNTYISDVSQHGCYYEIKVFYKLDLPIIESVFRFNLKGQTKVLYSGETTKDYCALNLK